MTKIEGSGSGSISQRHGSADPDLDPPQNVMDPQHCKKVKYFYMENIFSVLLVKFGNLPCFWIRIHFGNADPDPREPKQCRSIRILNHNTNTHNTFNFYKFVISFFANEYPIYAEFYADSKFKK
jgi:hypothetical protein